MCCNKLKLNGDKSELLVISSQYCPRPLLSSITIGCSVLQSSASARNLGVVFDNGLMFEKHISAICKLAFHHLRRIAKIRSYLSEESTIALIHAFITCRLDNGNALLYGLPKHQVQRLQSVQNCASSSNLVILHHYVLSSIGYQWSIALFLRSCCWFLNL